MTVRVEETLHDLAIDDYFEGREGVIWKVIKKREDGYMGIVNGAGEKVIVKPQHADRRVIHVIYGYDTMEEVLAAAEERIAKTLGGTVVARKIEPGDWVMPSLDELYAGENAKMVRAHLMLHHKGVALTPTLEFDDLYDIHADEHGREDEGKPTHTHPEGT